MLICSSCAKWGVWWYSTRQEQGEPGILMTHIWCYWKWQHWKPSTVEQRVEVWESAYIRRWWNWSDLSLKWVWSWWIWHPLCCVFEKSEFLGFLRLWEAITLSNGRLLCEHLTVCGGGRLDNFTYSHFESQPCANSIAKSFKSSFWELALRRGICNTIRELFEWVVCLAYD